MLISNIHSFTIVSKKSLYKKDNFVVSEKTIDGNFNKVEGVNVGDGDRRSFLKFVGGASVGAAVFSMIPTKAQALIVGSSPTAGIVGVKNTSNVGVNPATEDGNLAVIASKDFATESTLNTLKNKDFATELTLGTRASESTLTAIKTNSDKFLFDVDGKLLTANTTSGNQTTKIQDSDNNIINPATDESLILLRRMLKQIDSLSVVDSAQRQRVVVDNIFSGTITTVGTVSSVANMVSIGGVDARYLYIDTSRNMYANSIRNNLIYS